MSRGVAGSAFQIAMLFFSLGSTLDFVLFYRSRLIPRLLAGVGVVGSVSAFLVALGTLIFPERADLLQLGWAPTATAEVGTALWLVTKGSRPTAVVGGGQP